MASGASLFQEGFCATDNDQQSGFLGFVSIGQRDPAAAAPDVVYKAARFVAYNNDTKTYGEVSEPRTRQISVNNGKTSAVESLIVVKKAKA